VKDETEEHEIKTFFQHNTNILIQTPFNLNWLDEISVYETIKTIDIGISPLLDNEFNRGKSAFKLKQCMSCGVPVLGTIVGENKRFLTDGMNGYLCDNPKDFLEKIVSIKNSHNGSYQNLSINAKTTYSAFSIDQYCLTFIKGFTQKPLNRSLL